MSELARRRSARDIWISRGHLYAIGAGGGLAMIAAFAIGYALGRESVDLPPPASAAFTSEAGDDALVELLARVDSAATPDGGVDELTFPDALRGEPIARKAASADEPSEAVAVGVAGQAIPLPEAGDAPPIPNGSWTLVVGTFATRSDAEARVASLVAEGHAAWMGVESRDGALQFRASVGGFGSRVAAEDALEEMALPDGTAVTRY
jgi:cell division septation protein DedD